MSSQPTYTYTVSSAAYALPLLHAARYLSHTVIGILLGKIDRGSKRVSVEDALPLIHHYTSLSPMMEVALELGAAAASERGMEVVGLYVVPKDDKNSGLGRVGERILGEMKGKFDASFAWLVDNEKLGEGSVPYTIYTISQSSTSPQALPSKSSSSFPSPFTLDSTPNLPARTLQAIRDEKIHRNLVDFDDHLNDS
ncbi:hypothetical protein BD324DRAFT_620746 [Kockovaella imperatae]|uniref:MPN domain-containing protein n=1 Tax=Kockovaella imperatae TaxID=4999 RepID=A0A1Y1UK28_9TREE|nr:hypothetical protein BD324DRAFT_620746 [Kockovaella imperatae]ORX38408.1 hypothetical protein BD324DRAFT_620746 [Kockovaella imperatae]